MEFCPKCGAILVQKNKSLACPRCGYSSRGKTSKIKTSEKINERKEVGVLKGKDVHTCPTINVKCKKCGHDEAYFWTVQTRASDEAETKFFKCTKCGNTKRDYR